MKKAVDRIFKAVEKGEKIMVHGDYDADGVTSSVVMMSVLEKLVEQFGANKNIEEVLDIFIPHREKDGYGLKMHSVEEFVNQDINYSIIRIDFF